MYCYGSTTIAFMSTLYLLALMSLRILFSKFLCLCSRHTPQGIAFNTDGTKMFIVGQVSDAVYEYTYLLALIFLLLLILRALVLLAQETAPRD